jgi:hypothetical protein
VIEKKPVGHVTADPMQLVHARFVVGVHADRSYCVAEHAAAHAAEHIAISTCSQCNGPDATPVCPSQTYAHAVGIQVEARLARARDGAQGNCALAVDAIGPAARDESSTAARIGCQRALACGGSTQVSPSERPRP